MAQNEIQRPGLNEILRRSLTIKGDLPPANVLGAEIVPVLALENDRPEYLFLAGERRGQIHTDVALVAAQRSKWAFENPLGSGLIAVIESLTVEPGTGNGTIELWIAAPDVTVATMFGGAPIGPFNGLATDLRWYRRNNVGIIASLMACQAWFLTSAPALSNVTQITDVNVPAFNFADLLDRTGPWVLPPGWKFGVQPNVNAVGMCVSIVFRERAFEPGEAGINMLP